MLSISDFLEKNLIAREPMKQSMLGCSGVQRSVLLQVRDPLAEQTDDQLDQTLYVVAGQGTIKLGGRENHARRLELRRSFRAARPTA